MENLLSNMDTMAKEIREVLTDFMLNHSAIEPLRAYGEEELMAFGPDGNRSYAYLDQAGRKMQSSLSESYAKFCTAVDAVMKDEPDDVTSKISKFNRVVVRTIEHRLTWCENTQQALDRALAAFEEQLKLVKAVAEQKGGKA